MRRDADARRTAEEREAQLQTRRDARARRTTEEREAYQQHADHNIILSFFAYVFFAMATAAVSLAKIILLRLAPGSPMPM